jgi:PHD/YefM family antitoxin component YafN of YafNO toxin-antitoxin module
LVTRHGEEAVVILSAKDYRRLSGQTPTLMDCLLNAPLGEALEIERPKDGIRHLVL